MDGTDREERPQNVSNISDKESGPCPRRQDGAGVNLQFRSGAHRVRAGHGGRPIRDLHYDAGIRFQKVPGKSEFLAGASQDEKHLILERLARGHSCIQMEK